MNEDTPPLSVDRMPTLTEVLELEGAQGAGEQQQAGPASDAAARAPGEGPPAAEPVPTPAFAPDAAATQALVGEVLAELQPRIDMLFESRLREALAPALARAAEGLMRDARTELGSALHELVDDAVKRALQRRGGRW